MKITELNKRNEKDLFKTNWKLLTGIRNYLSKNGFKLLGNGSFAEVYGKPSSKSVIKIATSQDKCWLIYANWLRTQQDNPHLPKISQIKQYTDVHVDESLFVSSLERLKPLTKNFIRSITDVTVLCILYNYFIDHDVSDSDIVDAIMDTLYEQIKKSNDFKNIKVDWNSYFAKKNFIYDFVHKHMRKTGRNHPLEKTIQQIKTLSRKSPCSLDLHDGNFMFRPSTKTVVISDPLCDPY